MKSQVNDGRKVRHRRAGAAQLLCVGAVLAAAASRVIESVGRRTLQRMTSVPWHSLEPTACEKYVSIMLLREHPDGSRRRPSQGDHGIDVIVPISEDPRTYDVYQVKYFFQALNSSQRRQISNSAGTLLKAVRDENLNVRNWHLTIPLDPQANDEEWLEGLFKGTSIRAYWKGRTYLEGLASKYRDVTDYHIFQGAERVNELLKSALRLADLRKSNGEAGLSVDSIQESVWDILKILNADDPHYRYDLLASETLSSLEILPADIVMSQFAGKQGGPFIRIDVYQRYREALIDRPIEGKLQIRIPTSEAALIEQVEQFYTYGDPLALPPEFVSAEIDDPISGKHSYESMAVRLEPMAVEPVRLRLIVDGPDGERIRSLFVSVEKLTDGLSGGFVAGLKSDAGALVTEQRSRPGEGANEGNTRFNIRVEWKDKIAVKILEELKFADEIRSGRKLLLAKEFTGPFFEIGTMDEEDRRLIPDWLVPYAEALASLQEYATEPLRLVPPTDHGGNPVIDAMHLAGLLHGRTLSQTQPRWALEVNDPRSLVDEVNNSRVLQIEGPLYGKLAEATICIPNVIFEATEVTAELTVIGDRDFVVLSGDDAGLQLSVRRKSNNQDRSPS